MVNKSSAEKKTATHSEKQYTANNYSVVPENHRVYPGTISRINTLQIRKSVHSLNTSEKFDNNTP